MDAFPRRGGGGAARAGGLSGRARAASMPVMLAALVTLAILAALAGAAAAGRWWARRALLPELRSLRARVRELSARVATGERGEPERAGGEPPVRPQPREEPQQVVRGSRTVH